MRSMVRRVLVLSCIIALLQMKPASAATYNYQQHNVYVGGSCLVVITQWSNNDSGVTAWASSHTSGDPCISLRAAVLANLYGQVVTDPLYTTGSHTGAIGARPEERRVGKARGRRRRARWSA